MTFFNPSGVKPTVETDATFGAYVERAAADYVRLSKTPNQFDDFVAQISEMWQDPQAFNTAVLKYLSLY